MDETVTISKKSFQAIQEFIMQCVKKIDEIEEDLQWPKDIT